MRSIKKEKLQEAVAEIEPQLRRIARLLLALGDEEDGVIDEFWRQESMNSVSHLLYCIDYTAFGERGDREDD